MKIFISWSGEKSKCVANALREWLPMVIQSIQPYVSSEDIHKGERWSNDVSEELEASNFGIICVTKENVSAPWIQFEAGALSKIIESSRVCPFLLDAKISELSDPFKQFQVTLFKKDDIKKLIHSINSSCISGSLEKAILDRAFEIWWPQLESKLQEILESSEVINEIAATVENNTNSVLEEILDLTRQQHMLLKEMQKEEVRGFFNIDEFKTLMRIYQSFADVYNKNKENESIQLKEIQPPITEFYKILVANKPPKISST